MDKQGFMEPCCIGSMLPPILRQKYIVPFQTNGDVTFSHILRAVSAIAGNRLDVTVCVPKPDIHLLRELRWYCQRGWISKLTIVTHNDEQEFIKNEIGEMSDCLRCLNHKLIEDGLLVLVGERNKVAVQGWLSGIADLGLRRYTAAIGDDNVDMLASTTMSVINTIVKRRTRKKKQSDS
ncbi:MAG: hypothetical protein HUK07_07210 [Bacteroidaceae bacterium]|nr:hypothetical protein [Bacteroidaceae bacterium]